MTNTNTKEAEEGESIIYFRELPQPYNSLAKLAATDGPSECRAYDALLMPGEGFAAHLADTSTHKMFSDMESLQRWLCHQTEPVVDAVRIYGFRQK
jgi:hypothetical protein